jgi:protein involved in polysaccharide export with SLBB domain
MRSTFPSCLARLSRLPAFALLLLAGCATAGGPPIHQIAREINATLDNSEIAIGPGDVLSLRFAHMPEWNQEEITVQDDGYASFLGIGKIAVAGLFTDILETRLLESYASLIARPELTVAIEERRPAMASVLGEVRDPGPVEIGSDRHVTLVEALARRGGFVKASAHLSNVLLVRWDARAQQQLAWKIDARPMHWGEKDTIFLQPYDLVYVPNTPIDRVDIWIENYIRRVLPFPSSATVLPAVAPSTP